MNLYDVGNGPHHYNLFFADKKKGSTVIFDLIM